MDEFLNGMMKMLNKKSDAEIAEIKEKALRVYGMALDLYGRHAFRILEANVPIAVESADRPQLVAVTDSEAYFWTGQGRPFSLFAGADSYEKGAAKLFSPSGEEVWKCNPITKWERFQPEANTVAEGLWRISVSRPKGMHKCEYLDVPGTAGFLFLSKERYWR